MGSFCDFWSHLMALSGTVAPRIGESAAVRGRAGLRRAYSLGGSRPPRSTIRSVWDAYIIDRVRGQQVRRLDQPQPLRVLRG